MPYIKPDRRQQLDPYVFALSNSIGEYGELNYAITQLCRLMHIEEPLSYTKIALLTGVLENVKQEFYRRLAVPYEEEKAKINGDVY